METDPLSSTFSALSDPTRRAILARLAKGEASVGELADPFEISLPAISRHLKVLQQAGLIERKTEAQWRRCALNPEPLMEVAGWLERYREFWESRFDALEEFLKSELKSPSSQRKGQKRTPKNDS
ncbi:MAG: transcriptional regulator [Rhodospirillaceae bacterium]|nr:transcriptional regulator [Rhodospirillaceae bacterium]|tara:strand:- start:1760 stop:2134 length:375 start_codon:yes stop_codon:yes gene_type:complete